MDNLIVHKSSRVRELIERTDCGLWYLPPYNPELNPIEHLWSKAKSYLKKAGKRCWDELWLAVREAIRKVSPKECENYFKPRGHRI